MYIRSLIRIRVCQEIISLQRIFAIQFSLFFSKQIKKKLKKKRKKMFIKTQIKLR